MLAMVLLSLYAGKKTLRPAGCEAEGADIRRSETTLTWNPRALSPRAAVFRAFRRNEPPRRDGGLDEHRPRELRLALPPFDERDRRLGDAAALPRRDVQHLDKEGVAVGDETVERQRR